MNGVRSMGSDNESRPLSLSLGRFRDRFARGGGPWTIHINQLIGAALARFALRRGLRPVHLSSLNLVLGLATTAIVLLVAGSRPVLASAFGLIGWQLAFSFDCADGQLARAAGNASGHGAVLDLLGDFMVQVGVILALMSIALRGRSGDFVAILCVLVTAGWLVSPFYGGIVGADVEHHSRTAPLGRLGRLARGQWIVALRDYGLHIAVLPLLIGVGSLPLLFGLAVVGFLGLASLMWGVITRIEAGLRAR